MCVHTKCVLKLKKKKLKTSEACCTYSGLDVGHSEIGFSGFNFSSLNMTDTVTPNRLYPSLDPSLLLLNQVIINKRYCLHFHMKKLSGVLVFRLLNSYSHLKMCNEETKQYFHAVVCN